MKSFKETILFVFFIVFIIVIFHIDNYILLLGSLLTEILIVFITRINFNKLLKYILKFKFLLISILILNSLFLGIWLGILSALKLLVVLIATKLNAENLTPSKLSNIICNLLFFAKTKEEIAIIINLGIANIAVFSKVISNIRYVLIAKGFDFNLKNILTRGHIIFIAFFNLVFKYIENWELTLKSKGF